MSKWEHWQLSRAEVAAIAGYLTKDFPHVARALIQALGEYSDDFALVPRGALTKIEFLSAYYGDGEEELNGGDWVDIGGEGIAALRHLLGIQPQSRYAEVYCLPNSDEPYTPGVPRQGLQPKEENNGDADDE